MSEKPSAAARPPQMGTCDLGSTPHAKNCWADGHPLPPNRHCVNWRPVAPEKEARPTGQPDASLAGSQPAYGGRSAEPGRGNSPSSYSSGGAVPQTLPDAELEKMFNALLLELDSSIVDDVRKRVQAYALAVTAQKDAEIGELETDLEGWQDLANNRGHKCIELESELERRDKEISTLRAEVTRLKARDECFVCKASLVPETSMPRCEDCHPTDEQQAEWEEFRAGAEKKGTP